VARGGLPSHEFRNARSRQKSAACVDSAGSPQISASDMRMTVRLMDRLVLIARPSLGVWGFRDWRIVVRPTR
jgi:hypothetical protein